MVEVEVAFQGTDGSSELRDHILHQAYKLEQAAPSISRCDVVVTPVLRGVTRRNRFAVRVCVTLPDGELNVDGQPAGCRTHEDAREAIREAFDHMRRRLQDLHRKQHRKGRHHESSGRGRIKRISSERGNGVIEAPDGRAVRFHRDSFLDAPFESLREGDEVRFTELRGESGCWASIVHLVGRRH